MSEKCPKCGVEMQELVDAFCVSYFDHKINGVDCLRRQLAASQAENAKLKESLGHHQQIDNIPHKYYQEGGVIYGVHGTSSIDYVEKLRAENAKLRLLLCECRSDIFQTARVNQGNLDGSDPVFPRDTPTPAWIGTHFVHQEGVDVSLALVRKIDATLGAKEKSR